MLKKNKFISEPFILLIIFLTILLTLFNNCGKGFEGVFSDSDASNSSSLWKYNLDSKYKIDINSVLFEMNFDNHNTGPYRRDKLEKDIKQTAKGEQGFYHGPGDHGAQHISKSEVINHEGSKVLYVKYPKNGVGPSQSGVQFLSKISGDHEELFLSYRMKFKPGFKFVEGGKLPGFCGFRADRDITSGCKSGGGKPNADEGFSARLMWRPNGQMVSYLYHPNQKYNYADDFQWGIAFETGRWYEITQRIKLNSVGQRNGLLDVWVDKEKVLSRSDLEFRKIPQVKLNGFFFSTFYGGNSSKWAPDIDTYAYFDDFKIFKGTASNNGPKKSNLASCSQNTNDPRLSDITDIFLMAGQSNATSDDPGYDPNKDSKDNRIFVWTSNNEWKVADLTQQTWKENSGRNKVPKNYGSPTNHPAYQVARHIIEKDPCRVVAFIPTSYPGQKINKWISSGGGDTDHYNFIRSQVNSAISQVPSKNKLDMIAWIQGEADDGRTEYFNDLSRLVNKFRDEYWFDSTKYFVASQLKPDNIGAVHPHLGYERNWNTANDQIAKLGFDGDPMTDFTHNSGLYTPDGTHFDSESIRKIGERMASKYINKPSLASSPLVNTEANQPHNEEATNNLGRHPASLSDRKIQIKNKLNIDLNCNFFELGQKVLDGSTVRTVTKLEIYSPATGTGNIYGQVHFNAAYGKLNFVECTKFINTSLGIHDPRPNLEAHYKESSRTDRDFELATFMFIKPRPPELLNCKQYKPNMQVYMGHGFAVIDQVSNSQITLKKTSSPVKSFSCREDGKLYNKRADSTYLLRTPASEISSEAQEVVELSGKNKDINCEKFQADDSVIYNSVLKKIINVKSERYGWISFQGGGGVGCTIGKYLSSSLKTAQQAESQQQSTNSSAAEPQTSSSNDYPDLSGKDKQQIDCRKFNVNDKVILSNVVREITHVNPADWGWISLKEHQEGTTNGLGCVSLDSLLRQ